MLGNSLSPVHRDINEDHSNFPETKRKNKKLVNTVKISPLFGITDVGFKTWVLCPLLLSHKIQICSISPQCLSDWLKCDCWKLLQIIQVLIKSWSKSWQTHYNINNQNVLMHSFFRTSEKWYFIILFSAYFGRELLVTWSNTLQGQHIVMAHLDDINFRVGAPSSFHSSSGHRSEHDHLYWCWSNYWHDLPALQTQSSS